MWSALLLLVAAAAGPSHGRVPADAVFLHHLTRRSPQYRPVPISVRPSGFFPPPCASGEFRCRDGTCIDRCYICDTAADCPFGGDEAPEYGCVKDCPRRHFRCDNRCVSRDKICDGVQDCYDGYDEEKCKRPPAADAHAAPHAAAVLGADIRCDGGRCVDSRRRCDGYRDCRDGTDEYNCPSPEPIICRPGQFRCNDGSCIPDADRCNRIVDCPDISDELGCPCRRDEISCDGTRCLSPQRRCDGYPDCRDGTDEYNCPTPPPPCPGFQCDGDRCLDDSQRCDGRADCRDGSDEAGCEPPGCTPGQFRCNSGECIDDCYTCDGKQDCADNSDESELFGCRRLPPCGASEYRCVADGSCVRRETRCDGRRDCPDGQDEYLCPGTGLPPGTIN